MLTHNTAPTGSSGIQLQHRPRATDESRLHDVAAPAYGAHHNDSPYDDTRPPPYSVIDAKGQLHHANGRPQTLPVASTIAGALTYSDAHSDDFNISSTAALFQQSGKFSTEQKIGIEKVFTRYGLPIGMALRLEQLAGNKIVFILDDSKRTSDTELEGMKTKIRQLAEFLQFIPNAGISIKTLSGRTLDFKVDEKHPERLVEQIRQQLQPIRPARGSTSPLAATYEACVATAARDAQKTATYVLTSRAKLAKKARVGFGLFAHPDAERIAAKTLTKMVVNRPADAVPTVFFPGAGDNAKRDAMNRIDNVARNVNTVETFHNEATQIRAKQGQSFPYSEGMSMLSSLLGADPFWDQMDEGRIFSKAELEREFAVPLSEEVYDSYFEEAYKLQYKLFQDDAKAEKQSAAKSTAPSYTDRDFLPFSTSTKDSYINGPVVDAIKTFRKAPYYTPELEDGINKICTDMNIPIGMGLHLAELADCELDVIVDNSGSMTLSPEKKRNVNPGEKSRMQELQERLCELGPILAHIPGVSVTVRVMTDPATQSVPGPVMHFSQADFQSKGGGSSRFQNAINGVKTSSGTPLNPIFAQSVADARARARAGKTRTLVFIDGQDDEGQKGIKKFAKAVANKPHEKMSVTLCPCTNIEKDIGWLGLVDQVCPNTSSIDDYEHEKAEVVAKQGKSFPFSKHIYKLATLLGGNPLFDGLDEERIYSKAELEALLGRIMTPAAYDQYYNEAYELQCDERSQKLDSPTVETWQNWAGKAPASGPSGAARQGRGNFERLVAAS